MSVTQKIKELIQGILPKNEKKYPHYDKGNLVSLLYPHSYEAEQFKQLTLNLENPRPEIKQLAQNLLSPGQAKVIMVTSARSGEGKSFVAANLATTIARNSNKPVLLIDCDLRSPSCHSYFGVRNTAGLCEYLSGSASLSEVLIKPRISKLTLLPAGLGDLNSFKLLSSRKMASFIKELRNKCPDLRIIIDTAPSTMVAEGKILKKLTDGIVLVTRQRHTNHEEIKELISLLGREKILGFVINHFSKPQIPFLSRESASHNYYRKSA